MPFSPDVERVQNQAAFILHRRPYRDTSLILDLFSKDYGRLSLVAKGANTQKSRIKGILQAFQPLFISWSRKSEMGTLTNAESRLPPFGLQNEALYSALYVNEIMLKLITRDDPHAEIFAQYEKVLERLSHGENIEVTLRLFENEFLQSLGYHIDYFYDAESQQDIDEEKFYEFIPDLGFKLASENTQKNNQVSGADILAIAHSNYSNPSTLITARKISQLRLHNLLGDSEIKSRDLYKAFLHSKSPAL